MGTRVSLVGECGKSAEGSEAVREQAVGRAEADRLSRAFDVRPTGSIARYDASMKLLVFNPGISQATAETVVAGDPVARLEGTG